MDYVPFANTPIFRSERKSIHIDRVNRTKNSSLLIRVCYSKFITYTRHEFTRTVSHNFHFRADSFQTRFSQYGRQLLLYYTIVCVLIFFPRCVFFYLHFFTSNAFAFPISYGSRHGKYANCYTFSFIMQLRYDALESNRFVSRWNVFLIFQKSEAVYVSVLNKKIHIHI